MSRTVKVLVPLVLLCLTLAAVAMGATPKTGAWKGKLNGQPETKVTFKVLNSSKAINFKADSLSVSCGIFPNSSLQFRTVVLSPVKIRNGGLTRVKRYFSDGEEIGRVIVSGKFTSSTKVTGLVTYQDSSCSGDAKFTAFAQR